MAVHSLKQKERAATHARLRSPLCHAFSQVAASEKRTGKNCLVLSVGSLLANPETRQSFRLSFSGLRLRRSGGILSWTQHVTWPTALWRHNLVDLDL